MMRAIWFEDQELSIKEDLPIPERAADEALIRVRLAGVCSTDLEMVRGYYPFSGILGHEFVGEVVDSPNPSLKGLRVTGEINIVCGDCLACIRGDSSHCQERKTLGIHDWQGCFAEYLTLPVRNLHLIPDDLPDEIAVFTEPLGAALQIQEQVHIQPTDRVLIVGAGRLGQLIAQSLALTGCNLTVVVRHAYQEEILIERGIATLPEAQILAQAYDLVVDATGSPQGFQLAWNALRPRGKLILKSTYADNLTLDMSALVVDEISLIGSRCGPFEPAIRLLAAGQVDPKPLITARYSLEEGLAALAHAVQPGVFKVLITI